MPGANPEQLKAIEHEGGALLSAGAGSGKTFVLTEHLIYLSKKWIGEWSPEKEPDFSLYIKAKFSKTVLMTFTKKAAGEIGIRIGQKFAKALEDNPEQAPLWEKAIENLDALTVSTIHGYCYKLIKQGFFADINPNDEIIGEGEFGKQIEDIFHSWLEENADSGSEFAVYVLKERSAVLSALKNIVGDPTLRLMWKNMDLESFGEKETDEAVENLLFHQNFNELFDWDGSLAAWTDFEDKDWFKYLEKISAFVKAKNFGLRSVNALAQDLANEDFKIPRKPSAKAVPEDAKNLYELAKELKNFLKDNHEDLFCFEDEGKKLVENWYGNFKFLFEHVEAAYAASPGFTFGDLEYVVNRKLDDPNVRDMVKREYNYIIVDEFQDTSFIQFDIIGKIVDFDFNKVFCVGDVKQAIYGFRGGELGVFLEMQKKAPLNLMLLHNYRSDQNIIKFNNLLFDHVFKLGLNFEGKDHYAVEVVHQTIPLQERAKGKIFEIEADLSFLEGKVEKLNGSDVEYLEALALAEEIKQSVSQGEKVAVLYRKLKPSKILMNLLIESGTGFTSQVKVPMLEDPILGMFQLLVKNRFDEGKLKESYLDYALRSYFKLMGSDASDYAYARAKEFETNISYYGVYQSFLIFLSFSGFCVSNYQQSLENIALLIDMTEGNLEKVARKLEEWSSLNYSMDFQYGKNSGQVVIMSAHASKGLEFEKVLLGGIYTNDSSMPMREMFGKTPYSFKWAKSLEEKKKRKSPHYMLEMAAQKRKEFSESKRLFYVACTRAESSLGWARLRFGSLKASTVKGSWIYGIDSFLSSDAGGEFNEMVEGAFVDLKTSFDADFLARVSNQPPMFHMDNLGVETKLENAPSFLMPELSVTRLAQVSQCPRKFYLSNVLKLDARSLSEDSNKIIKEDSLASDIEELSSKSFSGISAAERGVAVHEAISKAILGDFVEIEEEYRSQCLWVKELTSRFDQGTKFISEKPLKFEFFQFMVSGIPDLIIQDSEENCLEVWDFKTGSTRKSVPESYWFQLHAYAYAMGAGQEKPIKMVLCYVDEQKTVEKTADREEIENYLWSHCQNLGRPDQTREDHCSSCDYSKICKGKSLSSCATSFSC